MDAWSRILYGFTAVYLAFCLLVLASVPSYGWWVAILVAIDLVKGFVAHTLGSRGYRVEFVYLCNQYVGVALVGLIAFGSGGASSPFFPFLAIFAGLFPVLYDKSRAIQSFVYLFGVIVLASFGPEQVADYERLFRLGTLICVVLALRVFGTDLLNSGLEYRNESLVDELTDLPNRRAFDAELEQVWERLSEQPGSVALIVGDVDHFKRVNDTHGHPTGDLVLQEVALELDRAFRAHDRAFRIGGEEFAFVIDGVSRQRAEVMADALRNKIRLLNPAGLTVTMSFGAAMYNGDPVEAWLRNADEALYKAKQSGRDRVEFA